MTWELAESGVGVITSVINGADLVPTFSAASVDDLRVEVCYQHDCNNFLFWGVVGCGCFVPGSSKD